jgi:hypothetical protein
MHTDGGGSIPSGRGYREGLMFLGSGLAAARRSGMTFQWCRGHGFDPGRCRPYVPGFAREVSP